MLETVKAEIYEQPSISFGQFFARYVMEVQDSAIDAEVSFALRNNFLSASAIDRIINTHLSKG